MEALAREGPLPETVWRQALTVELRFRPQEDGLMPRRGFSMVCGIHPETRNVVLGLRWAGRGERWFRL